MGKEEDNRRGGFGLVNHYGPDSLFAVITHDYLPHSLTLYNNWEDIRAHGYDPVLNIDVRLKSDILAANNPVITDRSAKSVRFAARMEVRTLKGALNLPKLISEFDKIGLSFDKKKKSLHDQLPGLNLVTAKGVLPEASMNLQDTHSEIFTLQLSLPSTGTTLLDSGEFGTTSNSFFSTLEQVVEAIYDYEDKKLPPTKLEFKPKIINSPFVARCSYCKSDYDAHHNLNCPHCNAAEPIFGSSNR